MKARVWALIVVLMLASVRLVAQEATPETEYRLSVPNVTTYLEAIPEIHEMWQSEIPPSYGKFTSNPIINIMLFELQQNYSEQEILAHDFNLLSSVYAALSYSTGGNPIDNPSEWGLAILRAWLRDNPTDLAHLERLEVPRYGIVVDQFDLNGDGINEFILQLSFDSYGSYVVLERNASQPEGYRVVETPLYWLNENISSFVSMESNYELVHFGDVTGDTIPEWLVYPHSTRGCGTLFVLTWQDNMLVNLLPENTEFCSPGDFTIGNTDDDPELEIEHRQWQGDNWRCEWTNLSIADWNGTSFVRLHEPTRLPDTLGCALREAEPLMWENRVSEAIPLYEAGLAAGWDIPTDDNPTYFSELELYARTRLALAYALNGQMTQSREILTELGSETSTSEAIDTMIAAMRGTDSALDMCVAAYNVWAEYELSTFFNSVLPITIQVGRQDYISGMMEDSPPDPEKAGCNAPQLINTQLANHTFTTDETPYTQLASLGISVLDTFVADFNADGMDEWLTWLGARVEPILFVPDGEQYVLSRPEIRRPNAYSHFGVQRISDEKEPLFVDYTVLDFQPRNVDYLTYDIEMAYCESILIHSYSANPGSIRLWRLANDEFAQMLEAPVCEPRPSEELFSDDGRQLFAAAVTIQAEQPWNSVYDDLVYTWNPVDQTYEPPVAAFATATPASFGTTVPALTDAYMVEKLDAALSSLRDGDPEIALTLIDGALHIYDPSVEQIVIDGLHYYRALALEALNRPDEALAEYIAIYDAAPESAWGMLAALHLERVE